MGGKSDTCTAKVVLRWTPEEKRETNNLYEGIFCQGNAALGVPVRQISLLQSGETWLGRAYLSTGVLVQSWYASS